MEKFITPQDFVLGCFFIKNCGRIKEDYCCFNHTIYYAMSILERNIFMTTVSTKNGRLIKVIPRYEEKKTLSVSDSEMDRRAVEAVKAAINKAKICKKPIAGYDKEKKAAYIEYANGDRKYAE